MARLHPWPRGVVPHWGYTSCASLVFCRLLWNSRHLVFKKWVYRLVLGKWIFERSIDYALLSNPSVFEPVDIEPNIVLLLPEWKNQSYYEASVERAHAHPYNSPTISFNNYSVSFYSPSLSSLHSFSIIVLVYRIFRAFQNWTVPARWLGPQKSLKNRETSGDVMGCGFCFILYMKYG